MTVSGSIWAMTGCIGHTAQYRSMAAHVGEFGGRQRQPVGRLNYLTWFVRLSHVIASQVCWPLPVVKHASARLCVR